MNIHKITHYDDNGKYITAVVCKRIDITPARSLFYSLHTGHTYRYYSTMKSFCIEADTITVYYTDNSYIIIVPYCA